MQFKQEKNSMFLPGSAKVIIAFFMVLMIASLLFKQPNQTKTETADLEHHSDMVLD